MEMEHINENLIKVLIKQEDLEERGIDFVDLISDQTSIERFFYGILEEVDVDKHFQGSEAVTFQVMPNQNGLELYISRTNIDEIDDLWEDELTRHLIERKRKSTDKAAKKVDKRAEKKIVDMFNKADKKSQRELKREVVGEIIQFQSLESFLKLAREVTIDLIDANLYAMNDNYYLVIKGIDATIVEEYAYNKLLAMLEYGVRATKVTELFLQEHGKLLRENDSLKYFGENF